MDFRRCLEVQMPYLGPVIGAYTDWTPLDGPAGPVPGGHRQARSLAVQTCWWADVYTAQAVALTGAISMLR